MKAALFVSTTLAQLRLAALTDDLAGVER